MPQRLARTITCDLLSINPQTIAFFNVPHSYEFRAQSNIESIDLYPPLLIQL